MHTIASLQKIFAQLPPPFRRADVADVPISGISIDSRAVQPGYLFVAMKGGSSDGHDYIQDAISKGASAVVGEAGRDVGPIANRPYVSVENPRHALTWIAAAFYNWPGHHLTVIGVTGTDGKTTTSNLIYEILRAAGIKAGLISTVNAVIGDEVLDTGFHVTTPDAHDVQHYLASMVEAGLTHVVLETTSHGWAQHRVDACEFDIGVVTNITHEHMDEHGNYENYRAAKARLFTSLELTPEKSQGNPRLAVINRDDRSFEFLRSFIKGKQLNYGLSQTADVYAADITHDASGVGFASVGKEFRVRVSSALVGDYNISNCLAALTATVYGLSIDPQVAARGIASLDGIPGRMERIEMGQAFTAIVDFAHTPNALRVALEAAKKLLRAGTAKSAKHAKNASVRADNGARNRDGEPRVICVFGSAGLRDKQKRRMMAETAAELADFSVLTAEDPRTESLAGILEDMAAGAKSKGGREGETFWRVPDRGEAIRFALRLAEPGDIVLSCGKGHEQSMCFWKTEYLWDDRTAMRAALAELLHIDGPKMPYLPSQDKQEEEWMK